MIGLRGVVKDSGQWLRRPDGQGARIIFRGTTVEVIEYNGGDGPLAHDEDYLYVEVVGFTGVRDGSSAKGFVYREFLDLESPLQFLARQA